MSSSLDRSYVKKRKRNSPTCSTPVVEGQRKPRSISISAVNTNTSSGSVIKGPKRSQLARGGVEPKRVVRKRRKRKRKRNKEREKKNSGRDWETKSEESNYGDANLRQTAVYQVPPSESESDVLFKDLGSPELVREAPRFVDDRVQSPVLRPRRNEIERTSFRLEDAPLPLKDFAIPRVRYTDSEDDEDEENEIFFRREATVKTYLGLRHEKRRKSVERVEKCREWLENVPFPTATSNLLWDNFVAENHEKISQYVARPVNGEQNTSVEPSTSSDVGKTNVENAEDSAKEGKQKKKTESSKMNVVRGNWDKNLQKWFRVEDVYRFPDREDVEFKRDTKIGSQLTLNQFLHKCKSQKENLKEELILLSSGDDLNNAGSSTGLMHNQRASRKKRSSSRKSFNSESKKPKIVDASNSELSRINAIRSFASRMNAKRKLMTSSESGEENTMPEDSYEFTVPSRKKVKRRDRNGGKKSVERERTVTEENKPKIVSVESLGRQRYVKDKQNWRKT